MTKAVCRSDGEDMGDISYAPLIEDMVWSYSRIKSFYDCPYKFYLKYIVGIRSKEEMFFSSYGSFIHKLIELYYRGEKTKEQLCDMYLQEFRSKVKGHAPSKKVFGNYFRDGLTYFKEFEPFPYKAEAVEKRVSFLVGDLSFVGYIDFFGKSNEGVCILDNKSKALKQRSGNSKPTKTDEELDEYLRQLYLYAAGIEQETGEVPKRLCFNCFRSRTLIEEPFRKKAYLEAKEWATKSVERITEETDFKPSVDYFKCTYLCDVRNHCPYYQLSRKK